MCGRYVLALRYGQVQRVLDDHGVPTGDFHQGRGGRFKRGQDYWEDGNEGDGAGEGNEGGDGAGEDDRLAGADDAVDAKATESADTNTDTLFQPSYNFAPGFHGIVVRPVRDDPERKKIMEEKPERKQTTEEKPYQLQVMKWGLVPSWTQRRPDYAAMLKTINCRSDSLVGGNGMWTRLRSRNRCVVVASGFYEWLSKGPRERVPHYIRRRDGLPLLMAGLWDRAVLDGVATYTYTIVTTDSNATLRFLHDRMPVLFDYGSRALAAWLDKDQAWSADLGSLLTPWPVVDPNEKGSLLVDVVSNEVNKTGHSAARYIVPVASADNKSNIANFFQDAPTKSKKRAVAAAEAEAAPPPLKKAKADTSATPSKPSISTSSTTNRTPRKSVQASGAGSRKITSFFEKG